MYTYIYECIYVYPYISSFCYKKNYIHTESGILHDLNTDFDTIDYVRKKYIFAYKSIFIYKYVGYCIW